MKSVLQTRFGFFRDALAIENKTNKQIKEFKRKTKE